MEIKMVKKVLNLYAGIGGNRKLWTDVEVVAVEINPEIANQYKEHFPDDEIIITDAHQFLLDNYSDNWDFIWSSPPCQTHSRTNYFLKTKKVRYPDMKLYEEIILLETYFEGKYCVENVIPYYEPQFNPTIIGRHCLWSNFYIPKIYMPKDDIGKMCGKNQKASKKPLIERNALNSKLGLHIFKSAFRIEQQKIIKIDNSGK